MSDNHNLPGHYLPGEKRFRTAQYFLDDQLRCSEAVSDFRSVKNLLEKAGAFDITQAFRFQAAAVRVKKDR